MKIIKQCLLNGEEVQLQDDYFVLELNAAGRGFVTVKTEQNCVGKSLILNLGEYDDFYCWFTGFVENEQQAQQGYKRLFVREKAAIFDRSLNCSLRHISLAELCLWLQQQRGIEFKYPDKEYSHTKIPLFTHNGSGFQLLHNIGRLFSIDNYVWQQSPDGSIYVGSWQDSRWAEASEAVEINPKHFVGQTATSCFIPINAKIRPGTQLNAKRVIKVTLLNDEYEVEWQDLDKQGAPKQKDPNRRMIEKNFPELAGGYHLPKMAKVVAVADPAQGGEVSDPFRPRYAVDIQLIGEDGKEDSSVPVYSAVPLPVTSTSSQGGDFAFPEIGTMVQIGFIDGRPDKPVVQNFFAQGKTVPQVAPGEILKQQRPEVFERTDAAGNMHKQTDQQISEQSFNREIKTQKEVKAVGKAERHIDSDDVKNVGGNQQNYVLGNDEKVAAGDKVVGVGGSLTQKVKGVALMLSEAQHKLVAPQSHMGTESVNIFRILENVIQVLADVAGTCELHTHNGGPKPDQRSAFAQQKSAASAEKARLTPIIS